MKKWPFGSASHTPRRDAIAFIASVAYPTDSAIDSHKRVRERMRYGLKCKHFRGGEALGVDFWRWATSKWEKLLDVDDYPFKPSKPPVLVNLAGYLPQVFAYGHHTPADFAGLKREFEQAHGLVGKLLLENKQLSAQLAKCEKSRSSSQEALDRYRRAEAETRAKRSIAGKKGKNVKHRSK